MTRRRRGSVCSALLDEILDPQADSMQRIKAAYAYAALHCKTGWKRLKQFALDLEARTEIPPEGEWPVQTEDRRLLYAILFAIAQFDNDDSHGLLANMLRCKDPFIRADVLEVMAFEKKTFDVKLVLPFVSKERHVSEIYSALYALQFHDFANKSPDKARKLIGPMLHHDDGMVRVFAIEALSVRESNRDLILQLKDDPHEQVRGAVAEHAS